ncbi:chemotaxis protein CheW [Simiduia agarivorans]|uniref:Chemotaxis protein CheW n=1 Tax=Simiduia agarivorans (strain DSM 21679 / JCM 13881 / BCRC 17597 / SA1) TaxID=1117647 RepID=K4KH97_SIMAS|nr:chemotaxis protein CheW [Simiduia agarivorans]AFU97318.1 CheW protein [Simiduia agarivorans SA1 = DSM 21679]
MPLPDTASQSVGAPLVLQDLAADEQAIDLLHDLDMLVQGNQLMTLLVGDEYYAIDIRAVTEIRRYSNATRLPNASDHVLGVINMRGDIVPILDLRLLLGVGDAKVVDTTVVIILSECVEGTRRSLGFVVDAVTDVIAQDSGSVQVGTPGANQIPYELYAGLISLEDKTLTLLDTQKMLALESD